MVEQDEKLSFRLLQEHNSIIEKEVAYQKGRIVKYIGDSVFAEFKTPESALLLIPETPAPFLLPSC